MSDVKPAASDDVVDPLPWGAVILGALVPALLFATAVGVALPIIPASATRLGGGFADAGLLAALLPIGKIVADLPAGALATRVGDDLAMLLASVVGALSLAAASQAPSLLVLQGSMLALGMATAVFQLARHAYLTDITPATHRARVLSTLGGVQRIGYLLGPLLGAAVLGTATIAAAYAAAAGCALLSFVVLIVARLRHRRRAGDAEPVVSHEPVRLGDVLREHHRLFATLGTATLLVGAVRGARQTVVPLWGVHLGLDPAVVSLIFGVSAALDVALFYPAGKVMDTFGRLWVAIPSMLSMGVSMALLPFTTGAVSLAVVAGLLGLANGMGSGIIMTVGADVAPAQGRSSFLGVWRLFQDTGDALGPLVITAGAAVGSLALGVWVAAGFGAVSSAALARWVPRYSAHANRRSRALAGLAPTGERSTG